MQALLVIDVQKAIVSGAFQEAETLAAIAQVIGTMRKKNRPIVFIQHCHDTFAPMFKGAQGWQLHEALEVQQGDLFIEKRASDAFYETNLFKTLQQQGVTEVVICGLQSEFCVDATCRAALSHGFDAILISDGHTTGAGAITAAQTIKHHNYALSNLAHPNHTLTLCSSLALESHLG